MCNFVFRNFALQHWSSVRVLFRTPFNIICALSVGAADETYSDISTPSTMLSRRTLEEAAESAIFCSSIVHDLVYRVSSLSLLVSTAAALKLKRAEAQVQRCGFGLAIVENRKDWALHTVSNLAGPHSSVVVSLSKLGHTCVDLPH
jgi:hypothetical protein